MDITEIRRFMLALPGTTEEPHFEVQSARVGGKMYATWGSDGEWIHVFLDPEGIAAAIASMGAEAVTWGPRTVGVRVLLPADVRALLVEAWKRRAPKRVVAAWAARGA